MAYYSPDNPLCIFSLLPHRGGRGFVCTNGFERLSEGSPFEARWRIVRSSRGQCHTRFQPIYLPFSTLKMIPMTRSS
jgi:hypothetical protein